MPAPTLASWGPAACQFCEGWLLPFVLGVALGVLVGVAGYRRNG